MNEEQRNELVRVANVLEATSGTLANALVVVDDAIGERHTHDLEELANELRLSSLRVRDFVAKETARGRR